MCKVAIKWLLIMFYWAQGKDVILEFDSQQACVNAAKTINGMFLEHFIATGRTPEDAQRILDKDYTCIPKK